jgi:hypothetical protein
VFGIWYLNHRVGEVAMLDISPINTTVYTYLPEYIQWLMFTNAQHLKIRKYSTYTRRECLLSGRLSTQLKYVLINPH